MKRLLIISDVHRDRHGFEEIINRYQDTVDYILSVGDTELSTAYLNRKNVIAVKGNFPFDGGGGYHKQLQVEDVNIFMTHGHKFGVKRNNLDNLYQYTSDKDIDLVLYGHTHIASVDERNGILYINPGSTRQPRGSQVGSYALLTITGKEIQASFFDAKTFQEITI